MGAVVLQCKHDDVACVLDSDIFFMCIIDAFEFALDVLFGIYIQYLDGVSKNTLG